MSVKILIPADQIVELKENSLTIDTPNRCSRCDKFPADFFETHRLTFRAGYQITHLLGKRYKLTKKFTLKLRVCETCYLSDFITDPDMLDRDTTKQGKIAHFYMITRLIGAFFAAIGFLLLTPIIPETPSLSPFKALWQIPVAVAIIILLLSWMGQRKQQNQVQNQLESAGIDPHAHTRSKAVAQILTHDTDLSEIGLEITMKNENWAKEAANQRSWTIKESLDS